MTEDKNKLSIGKKIEIARIQKGLNQTQLAKMIGVSSQTVWQWERGLSAPKRKRAELVANVLDISLDYLFAGASDSNNEHLPSGSKVPLISWENNMKDPQIINWLACPIEHGPNTFALRVKGESMFNSITKPSFSEGDIIFIDPDRPILNNSLVVVDIPGYTESVFRKLLIDGDKKFLKVLNPSWPDQIIVLDNDAVIRGVVILKVEII